MGVKSTTTYDQYGNSTANVVQPSADAPFMRSETVYTNNGNYASSWKDARGNSSNALLTIHGKVMTMVDPSGQWTHYGYDNSNRVTSVSSDRYVSGEFLLSKNLYEYTNDRLTKISHNTTENDCDVHYTFEYDDLGRKTAVKVGNQELSRNVYSNDRKGLLDEMNFGNGAKVRYEYDDFGRTTAIYVDEPDPANPGNVIESMEPKYEFVYDARGIASVIKDNVLMTETRVTSDLADRPSESITRDANGNLLHKSVLNYDGKNRVKEFVDILPESTHKTAYTYDADNRVTEVKFDNSDTHKVNYSYDLLNRITTKCVTNGVPYTTTYGYVDGDTVNYGANATTPLISTITQGSGANAMNFAYTYDNRGNITSETRNGVTVSYEYDELGQLIRVNDPNDTTAGTSGTTWIYTYDRGGNILRKDAHSHTTGSVCGNGVYYWVYTYDSGWKDQLKTVTKHDSTVIPAAQTLVANFDYDAIGNPESDNTWTYTWEKGRQLKSMHNGSMGMTMEFKYNSEGIRTQKVKKVNGVVEETINYILSGKKIVALTNDYENLYFTYDASGAPATVIYNGATFTYVKNLQGDIVGILDANGDIVVKYQYDAWGKLIKTSGILRTVLGKANPFRYRGYVYDEEIGLYYLRSRYYEPELGRFLNTDSLIDIDSLSLFVYCKNSPVLYKDSTGSISEIDLEFVFDKNYFRQFVNYTPEKSQALIASGDYEGIPCLVNQNFKEISGYDFYIPGIKIYGKDPCCVEFESYVQYRGVQNLTSATIKVMLEILSAEKMDEIIDCVASCCNIPVDGAMVSKIAEGILHIDEKYTPLLDDSQVVMVHAVRVKYNYLSFGAVYANYLFYESIDGSYNCYDGIHARAEYKGKNYTYFSSITYKP